MTNMYLGSENVPDTTLSGADVLQEAALLLEALKALRLLLAFSCVLVCFPATKVFPAEPM